MPQFPSLQTSRRGKGRRSHTKGDLIGSDSQMISLPTFWNPRPRIRPLPLTGLGRSDSRAGHEDEMGPPGLEGPRKAANYPQAATPAPEPFAGWPPAVLLPVTTFPPLLFGPPATVTGTHRDYRPLLRMDTTGSGNSSSKSRRRKRSVFTKEQIHILKNYFKNNLYPGFKERENLSKLTNIPEDRIHVWFHNRRARQSLQQKNQAPECSTSLRQMCLDDVSSGPVLEEDFSQQELSTLSTFRRPSKVDEPIQAGPISGCSRESSTASTTEPICSYGYGIPQRNPFYSFQNMGPSNEFQLCDLIRSTFQGRSNQWASPWTLNGTQVSENTPNFFYGGGNPPLHLQEQDWTMALLYSNKSTIAFPGYRGSVPTSAVAATPPTELPQQSHPHQLSSLNLMPQHPCATGPYLSGTTSHLISTSVTGASNSDTDTIIIKEEEQGSESFCS
ncbi:uncharacterized protein LOC141553019 [Sminthopsis crassicaudata]|uniref:uncharacterized protein LOC141553019 n=1 Tax=Sminthopsis crassicaudata TaxID=9301 RepID=UPI003D6983FD